ncbi:MAG: ribulose-phosphate 3-epimerase [Candidatus Daviesbacteria bacterium]|nr:MAG: ribulose-phosphate 3-epimerase [Candidatus Daviesbacteria bacterium]
MIKIIPAILATTEEEYKDKLLELEKENCLKFDWVQIDFMDNKFVQNQSITPEIIAKYPTQFQIEAQLMVEYPENWVDELVKIPVRRIVFPVEDTSGLRERISHIKNHGIKVGLSINPETDLETVEPYVGEIDIILVMSVNPGFGGQQFQPQAIEKVKEIKQKNWPITIEVDGGINKDVLESLEKAGADSVVIGSHLPEILHGH